MSNGGHYKRKNLERQKPTHPAKQRQLERGLQFLKRKQQRAKQETKRWF